MQKTKIIIIIFAVLSLGLIASLIFDFPASLFGVKPTPTSTPIPIPTPGSGLVITSLQPNDVITSPLRITGYVNGDSWIAFEGQVGLVNLFDAGGRMISSSILAVNGEWMKEPPIDFEAMLMFQKPPTETGSLVFSNENPAGIPENNREFNLPIRFVEGPQDKMQVKVFFNNSKLDPEFSCNKVSLVLREIPKTEGVARAALEELLKGPTEEEKAEGYFTSINQGVIIQSLIIENGVAKVDFDEQLGYQVGGSCKVAAIRAEITQTLRQFPTVKNVIISIDGRTEDILQP